MIDDKQKGRGIYYFATGFLRIGYDQSEMTAGAFKNKAAAVHV